MKLAVSNIAWNPEEDDAALALLRREGVQGVEIAPTKLWPDWAATTPRNAAAAARRLRDLGFEVPAFQAILFGVEGARLFGGGPALFRLVEHVQRVAALAKAMDAEVLVFGAPKLRDPGSLSPEAAFQEATAAFTFLAEAAWGEGPVIGLEPNPPAYGCRFAVTTAEAAALVRAVDHPGLKIHLDCGQMAMTSEDPSAAVGAAEGLIAHVHASEPSLGGFEAPKSPHARLAEALARSSYDRWVSIEMRRAEPDALDAVRMAIRAARTLYAPCLR